jgi:hypothetical protein
MSVRPAVSIVPLGEVGSFLRSHSIRPFFPFVRSECFLQSKKCIEGYEQRVKITDSYCITIYKIHNIIIAVPFDTFASLTLREHSGRTA